MLNLRLYMLQRITALIMAPLVLGHLALMIYAVQGGLTASEILSRTQGSMWWGLNYGLFVLAAALHGAIGLRTICAEWLDLSATPQTKRKLDLFSTVLFCILSVLGLSAVYGVVAS